MSHSHAPIVVTHQDNLRFEIRIGDHVLVTDQPRSNGGEDAGPAPLDFLAAGLGACVAFYVKQFCAAREIPYDGLQVEVRYHAMRAPARVGGYDVRVLLPPSVPDSAVPLIERVARSCPAHATLAHGADVVIALESMAPR